MKVTTQGEEVINLLWDVIAAKGFEKDMYFAMAAIDIRGLPKLEGTVHVNMALIIKFMANYFFAPARVPEVPRRDEGSNDAFCLTRARPKGWAASSSTTTASPTTASTHPIWRVQGADRDVQANGDEGAADTGPGQGHRLFADRG